MIGVSKATASLMQRNASINAAMHVTNLEPTFCYIISLNV
jgi:hypothetical protein